MRRSLVSLVSDLEIRAALALEALGDAPELNGRTRSAAHSVQHIGSEARRLLDEDLVGEPDGFYDEYRDLTSGLFERESWELPFLLHHDLAAIRATRLCGELLKNVAWPYDPILVSTFSTEYYWTHPTWSVIAIPSGEERRLLGVPDLCHELGHTVYARDDKQLVGDFILHLAAALRAEIDPDAPRKAPRSHVTLTGVFSTWTGGWLQEFTCDLVATYLIGPAYPRQHARLRAMSQPPTSHFSLSSGNSHPADHARMRASLDVLSILGFDAEAAIVSDVWNEMLDAAKEKPPDEFDLFYPPPLLKLLAERVTSGCRNLGLRPYDPDADPRADIPRLTNNAWEQFTENPESFKAWEEKELNRLWADWGV
jgi:hypothetical protein